MRKNHTDRYLFDHAPRRRDLLNRTWPNWRSDPVQYEGLRRWRSAIYHYFLRGCSLHGLASKLRISFDAAHSLVRNIRRASRGRACRDGAVHTLKRGQRGRDRQPRVRAAINRAP
jgi:hypothetical protein